jgi:hypothetical protein
MRVPAQQIQACQHEMRTRQAAPTPIAMVVKAIGPERAMNGLDQMSMRLSSCSLRSAEA